MLKKSLLIFTLFASPFLLNALTIDNIVDITYKNNYKLKALEKELEIAKEEINLSSKWNNPILTFGATDLQFEDITRRDKEPMQSQFIGFTQTIPIGEKLETKKKITTNEYEISKYEIEDKKLLYKSKIYEYVYSIKLLEKRVSLFEEFKENSTKLEKLLKELYKYNKASQIEILNIQIMIQELNLKIQNLKSMINTFNLKLEEITYEKIENIEVDINIKNVRLNTDIKSHPKILALIQNSKKFKNLSIFEEEKKNSDLKFSISYFQRDEKFDDYINLSFAIPLSVYGTEDIKSKKAKFKSIQINHQIEDIRLSFKNQIKTLQQNIDDSLKSLTIIEKDILPKFNHLQKILENYNSFNSIKMIDSKSLINNFNEIIKYKQKSINEKERYFTALAKSIYFTKEN